MLSRNLRGEMIADLGGAKLSLSDSRFIQVIAKSLSISCKEVMKATFSHFLTVFCIGNIMRRGEWYWQNPDILGGFDD